MAKLTITSGNKNLDGVYELDTASGFDFTKNEWFLINKRVGITVADLTPGSKIDMNVMTALGLIVLARAGKEQLFDVFMETTDSQTVWEWDDAEVEDDDVPLPLASEDDANKHSAKPSSGANMNGSSEPSPDATRAPTGSPPSGTTSTYAPRTSETSPRIS